VVDRLTALGGSRSLATFLIYPASSPLLRVCCEPALSTCLPSQRRASRCCCRTEHAQQLHVSWAGSHWPWPLLMSLEALRLPPSSPGQYIARSMRCYIGSSYSFLSQPGRSKHPLYLSSTRYLSTAPARASKPPRSPFLSVLHNAVLFGGS